MLIINVERTTAKKTDASVMPVLRLFLQMFRQASFKCTVWENWALISPSNFDQKIMVFNYSRLLKRVLGSTSYMRRKVTLTTFLRLNIGGGFNRFIGFLFQSMSISLSNSIWTRNDLMASSGSLKFLLEVIGIATEGFVFCILQNFDPKITRAYSNQWLISLYPFYLFSRIFRFILTSWLTMRYHFDWIFNSFFTLQSTFLIKLKEFKVISSGETNSFR